MIVADQLPRVVMPEDEPAASSVPVEVPIVAAALGAADVVKRAEWLLWSIRHAPRDEASVRQRFAEVQTALSDAWADFDKYATIRTCRGSA